MFGIMPLFWPMLFRHAITGIAITAPTAVSSVDLPTLPPGHYRTPPMGWRSWNLFEFAVDQTLLQAQVDCLTRVRPGNNGRSLLDLGYKSIGLDDGWQVCGPHGYHDKTTGKPIVNLTRFPDLRAMTAYARKKGVSMGWYHNNCGCHGSADVGREVEDAIATVAYGFEGIKVDSCGPETNMTTWRNALDAALAAQHGGPANLTRIHLENCRNYEYTRNVTMSSMCAFDTFRTTEDNSPDFLSIMGNLLTNAARPGSGAGGAGGLPVSHPGCFAYPDMLEITGSGSCAQDLSPGTCGHSSPERRVGGLDVNESRAHFGAWCIVSSPLILGHDLSDDKAYDAAWPIVSNTEALRINQVWAGDPGRLVGQGGGTMENLTLYHGARCECVWTGQTLPHWTAWAKRIEPHGRSVAVLVINNGDKELEEGSIAVSFAKLVGFPSSFSFSNETDVWSGRTRVLGHGAKNWQVPGALAPHSSYFAVLESSTISEGLVFI